MNRFWLAAALRTFATVTTLYCSIFHVIAQSTYQSALGGTIDEVATCVASLADGSNIIGGRTRVNEDVQIPFAMRVDARGNLLWMRPCSGSQNAEVSDVLTTPDNDAILVGTGVFGNMRYPFLTKIKSDGTIAWEKTLITQINGIRPYAAISATLSLNGRILLACNAGRSDATFTKGDSTVYGLIEHRIKNAAPGSLRKSDFESLKKAEDELFQRLGRRHLLIIELGPAGDLLTAHEKNLTNGHLSAVRISVNNLGVRTILANGFEPDGNPHHSVHLIRMDSLGNTLTSRAIAIGADAKATDCIVLPTHSTAIVTGWIVGKDKSWIVEIDEGGIVRFNDQKSFASKMFKVLLLRNMSIASYGTWWMAGYPSMGYYRHDALVAGSIKSYSWNDTYYAHTSDHKVVRGDETIIDAVENSDGSVTMVGTTTIFGAGGSDVYIARVDDTGNTMDPNPYFLMQIEANLRNERRAMWNEILNEVSLGLAMNQSYQALSQNPSMQTATDYMHLVELEHQQMNSNLRDTTAIGVEKVLGVTGQAVDTYQSIRSTNSAPSSTAVNGGGNIGRDQQDSNMYNSNGGAIPSGIISPGQFGQIYVYRANSDTPSCRQLNVIIDGHAPEFPGNQAGVTMCDTYGKKVSVGTHIIEAFCGDTGEKPWGTRVFYQQATIESGQCLCIRCD